MLSRCCESDLSLRSAACVHRTTRSNVPGRKPCELPPKPRGTVKSAGHEFLTREGLFRNTRVNSHSRRIVSLLRLISSDSTQSRSARDTIRCGARRVSIGPPAAMSRAANRVNSPPKPRDTVKSAGHDLLSREGLLRNTRVNSHSRRIDPILRLISSDSTQSRSDHPQQRPEPQPV
jgi:hypothetical protein